MGTNFTYYERNMKHCHVRVSINSTKTSVYSESFCACFVENQESVAIYDSINEKDVLIIPFPTLETVADAIRDLEEEKELY